MEDSQEEWMNFPGRLRTSERPDCRTGSLQGLWKVLIGSGSWHPGPLSNGGLALKARPKRGSQKVLGSHR